MNNVSIVYKGNIIGTIEPTGVNSLKRLLTSERYLEDDILFQTDGETDIELYYGNVRIAQDISGSVTLLTAGKYLQSRIDTFHIIPAITNEGSATVPNEATYICKWTLPRYTTVLSFKMYRGYTPADMTISKETLIRYGTELDLGSPQRIGYELTMDLTDLDTGTYQHALFVLRYRLSGGTEEELISDVVKLKIL